MWINHAALFHLWEHRPGEQSPYRLPAMVEPQTLLYPPIPINWEQRENRSLCSQAVVWLHDPSIQCPRQAEALQAPVLVPDNVHSSRRQSKKTQVSQLKEPMSYRGDSPWTETQRWRGQASHNAASYQDCHTQEHMEVSSAPGAPHLGQSPWMLETSEGRY